VGVRKPTTATQVRYVRPARLEQRSAARMQGDRELDLAADVFVELGAAKLALVAGARWFAFGLLSWSRMLEAIRKVPTLTLTGVPRDDEIQRYFRKRRWGIPVRLAVGVLVLPDDPDDYLRGRQRQALRNNCNRARELGWRYVVPTEGSDLIRWIDEILEARAAPPQYRPWLTRRVNDGEGEFRFVVDEHDEPVAMGVFTVAGPVAMLHWMISDGRKERSSARYLLSAELAAELTARRIRHVLTESVLFLPAGFRYFQKLLGYEPYTLVFSDSP
jgi:hypothetical protein